MLSINNNFLIPDIPDVGGRFSWSAVLTNASDIKIERSCNIADELSVF